MNTGLALILLIPIFITKIKYHICTFIYFSAFWYDWKIQKNDIFEKNSEVTFVISIKYRS